MPSSKTAIRVYVSEAERDELMAAARDERISMAEYVRRRLLRESGHRLHARATAASSPSMPKSEPPATPLPKIAPRHWA